MKTGVEIRANSTVKLKTPTGNRLDWAYPKGHDFSKITEEFIRYSIAWCGEDMREHLAKIVEKAST